MTEYEPLDPTMLAVMEIYRRQIMRLTPRQARQEAAALLAAANYAEENQ